MRGIFVTFEGGEGAGKSTLLNKVADYLELKGLCCVKTQAPGGTSLGRSLREILLYKKEIALLPRAELLLFLADRAQHVDEVILPALQRGSLVLCDRFTDSTRAYQSGGRGLDDREVYALCEFAAAALKPDLTLYLDIDPLLAMRRIVRSTDRIESEALLFHQKIRAAFLKIAKEESERIYLIDASASFEEVFQQACRQIDVLLSHR